MQNIEVAVNFFKHKPPKAWMILPTSCPTTIQQVTSWSHNHPEVGLKDATSLAHTFPQVNRGLPAIICPSGNPTSLVVGIEYCSLDDR